MKPILDIQNLTMNYGALTAVDDVSFNLYPGQFMGLIGPNGSGKTSLLKCIAGAQIPTGGDILLEHIDVTRMTPAERSNQGLSLKFQITSVFPNLTVFDNLLVALQAGDGLSDLLLSRTAERLSDTVNQLLERYFIAEHKNNLASELSHGQQQWLEIAMAMCRQPRVLLLDEPTAGMSPQERQTTGEFLTAIRESTSLIIVEHDLDFVCEVCDQLTVLDQGKLIATGSTDEIQEDSNVKDIYLNHGSA